MSEIDNSVKKAIQTIAEAKIAEALGGPDIIGKMIEVVLKHADTSYGTRDKRTNLERIVEDCILVVVREEVRKFVAENETIRTTVHTAVSTKASEFTAMILDAFMNDDWRAQIDVHIGDKD